MKKLLTSLKGQLLSIGLIPIIGISIIMYFSIISLNELGNIVDIDQKEIIPNIINYEDVLSNRVNIGYYTLQAVHNKNKPKDRKESIEKLQHSFDKLKKAIEAAKNSHRTTEEIALLNDIMSKLDKFYEVNEKIISTLKETNEKDDQLAESIATGEWQTYAKQLKNDVTKVLDSYRKRVSELNLSSQEIKKAAKMRLNIQFAIIIFLNSLILLIAALKISKKLINVINILTSGADRVAGTSKQTAETSTELSASVTETASALQETSSSVEETSSMISRNAENAKKSMQVASESKVTVKQGLDSVKRMSDAIEEISDSNNEILNQVELSNKEMQEIVNVITEIGNKTKVINDIVFQTKLLSFNASVEAARAGEHGKGFAVVAEEVGNLAKMSGESATEISTMLESSIIKVKNIADQTKNKVDRLVLSGKEKVENGVKIADECSVSLNLINSNVEKVNDLVHEISNASQEQAQGMIEINKAMLELDHASSLNNQISLRVSQSAEELKTEVESIRVVIKELDLAVNGQS